MWSFPKQFGLSFYLTAILGALLAILLVLSPRYKPKRIIATAALLVAIILAAIIGWRDLPLIGLLSGITNPFYLPRPVQRPYVTVIISILTSPIFLFNYSDFQWHSLYPRGFTRKIRPILNHHLSSRTNDSQSDDYYPQLCSMGVHYYCSDFNAFNSRLAFNSLCRWPVIINCVTTRPNQT